jgi:hypothetical protein
MFAMKRFFLKLIFRRRISVGCSPLNDPMMVLAVAVAEADNRWNFSAGNGNCLCEMIAQPPLLLEMLRMERISLFRPSRRADRFPDGLAGRNSQHFTCSLTARSDAASGIGGDDGIREVCEFAPLVADFADSDQPLPWIMFLLAMASARGPINLYFQRDGQPSGCIPGQGEGRLISWQLAVASCQWSVVSC